MMGARQRGPGYEVQQAVVHLDAQVDVLRLRQAWLSVVQRHEGLRLAIDLDGRGPAANLSPITSRGWQPTQTVLASPELPFSIRETDDLDAFLRDDRAAGLALDSGPLALPYRLTLIERSAKPAVLVFTHHHACLDGRSLRLVLEDVFLHYDGLPWSSAPVTSFHDHCEAWHRRDRLGERQHFERVLEGFELTHFPALESDNVAQRLAPRASNHAEVRRRLNVRIDSANGQGVERVAPSSRGVVAIPSLGSVIQAAWALVLGTYTRSDDVIFGLTRSGRHLVAQAESMVGCLINTLPVRVKLGGTQSAAQLIEGIHAQGVATRPYEHAATSEIQGWLGTERALFNSLIVFERYSLDAELKRSHPSFAARRFELHEQSSFPLVLAAYQEGATLDLVMSFDRSQWSPESMDLVLQRVKVVIRKLLDQPDAAVSSIDTLMPGEHEALLAHACGPLHPVSLAREGQDAAATTTPAASATLAPLATALDAVVRAQPDAAAFVEADGRLTSYRRLAAERDGWSAVWQSHFNRDGTATPIEGHRLVMMLPRGRASVALQWSCITLGVVFTPIDAGWPLARQAQVARAANPHAIVGESQASAQALLEAMAIEATPTSSALVPVCWSLAEVERWVVDQPGTRTASSAIAAHDGAAYTIFTSGSTGAPKGVEVPRSALAAHARGAAHAFELTPEDRVLQFASPAFDVALEEIWPTLLAGASMVALSEATPSNLDHWLAEIKQQRISVLNIPSAFFHVLMQHLQANEDTLPSRVRLVIIGSEKPSPQSIATFFKRHAQVRLINAYGPTEATITCALCDLSEVHATQAPLTPLGAWVGEAPVGGALGSSQVVVLDRRGHLCPAGAVGEIHVVGPQVATRYLGGTELDALRFSRSPFDPSQPMVATGDLGRWRSDGLIEFVGRADDQVKIRGIRVEPGEVEQVLLQHAGVGEAAVIVRTSARGNELVAFAVLTQNLASPVTAHELRAALADRLPTAFVPSEVIVLDALPMMRNGKVDRAALKLVTSTPAVSTAPARPRITPTGDLEIFVADIFGSLLDLREVDVDASFFDLGGHSLLAMRLLALLNRVAPEPITLATIFSRPSVRELAVVLASSGSVQLPNVIALNGSARMRARTDDGQAAVYFICGVQLYADLAKALDGHVPAYGIFLDVEMQVVEGQALALDIPLLARAYVDVLRQQQPTGPYVLSGVSIGGLLAYEMAQVMRQQGDDVQLLVLLDTILPRAIRARGLAGLVRRGVRKGAESLTGHHPLEWLQRWLHRTKQRFGLAATDAEGLDAGRGGELAAIAARTQRMQLTRDRMFRLAAEKYDRMVKPYAGPVVVVRARETYESKYEATAWDLGWGQLIRHDAPVFGAEGDHIGILTGEGAVEIARIFCESLAGDGFKAAPAQASAPRA